MNTYRFSKYWFEFASLNEEINSNHTAMVFFIIDLANRLNWAEQFGLPTLHTQETLKMRSYKTYKKTLDDLVEFGVIKILQKSANQYTSNIICFDSALVCALVKNTEPTTKATAEADTKASPKQSRHNKTILNYIKTYYKLIETKTIVDKSLHSEISEKIDLDTEENKQSIEKEATEFLISLPDNIKNLAKKTGMNKLIVYQTLKSDKETCELSSMFIKAFYLDETYRENVRRSYMLKESALNEYIIKFGNYIQSTEKYLNMWDEKSIKNYFVNWMKTSVEYPTKPQSNDK